MQLVNKLEEWRTLEAENARLTALLAERDAEIKRLRETVGESVEAVAWLLEFWPSDENPGPGIRSDLDRWRAALAGGEGE